MLGTFKPVTNIEDFINTSFSIYKKDILINFYKQIKDEELKGESCRQYNFSFYLALYLITLVYKEFLKYPLKDWSYFEDKYNLKKLKECLLCNNIDLNKILKSFQLPIVTGDGINFMEVEENLEVEPTTLLVTLSDIVIIDLKKLLNTEDKCELSLICTSS
jgi:hypothetical protein